MPRYGLIIDLNRCTGCYACVVACRSENSTRPEVSWIRIQEDEEGEYPEVSRRYTPLLCMQCAEIPCARVCPSEAILMGEDGIVHLASDRCQCKAHPCIEACPFGVLQVNRGPKTYFPEDMAPCEKTAYEKHPDGVVEKCTLCSHRLGTGLLPACVQACPSQAMLFGSLDDPDSTVARLIAKGRAQDLKTELKVNPSVLYMQS